MGQEMYGDSAEAQALFEQANEILGFDLASLCFSGPKATLDDTINAQPALLTTSIAAFRVLQQQAGPHTPAYVAGHSMGEYSALVAAGALSFTDGLRLARERGRLMKKAGQENPGGMAAVLGLDQATVADVCRSAGDVQIANDNAPGQIVISGTSEGIDRATTLAQDAGAKRVIRLAVSIAAHSELMRSIVDEFTDAVRAAKIKEPQVPVVANVTARPLESVPAIEEELIQQLTHPVRWVESVRYMVEQGVDTVIEIGPGDVLTGLVRRIDRGVSRLNVNTPDDITEIGKHL